MKFKSYYISILVTIIVSLFACDKVEEAADNYIMYNDIKYPLSGGVLMNNGKKSDESFDFELILYSKDVQVNYTEGVFDSLAGHGEGIEISLYSASSTQLSKGDYIFDEFHYGADSTFYRAKAIFNYELGYQGNEPNGTVAWIEGGVVSVLGSGSVYEIVFNFKGTNNSSIIGYYKGSLMRFE